jgi:hypothetical protein
VDTYQAAIEASIRAADLAPDPFKLATFKAVLEDHLIAARAGRRPEQLQRLGAAEKPSAQEASLSPIAAAFAISEEDAACLYDIEGDAVRLAFEPSRLDRKKSAGTEQVFFLLCAARHGNGQGCVQRFRETR